MHAACSKILFYKQQARQKGKKLKQCRGCIGGPPSMYRIGGLVIMLTVKAVFPVKQSHKTFWGNLSMMITAV
jgi:hypothetical protein